jgi:hypothetical protein
MNSPPPLPPLILVKEALHSYEMQAPTLNARGKEVLSCVIIRKGDVCIAPPLSTVCQVRAATSTISTLATSIMKILTAQLSVPVSMETKSSKTPHESTTITECTTVTESSQEKNTITNNQVLY